MFIIVAAHHLFAWIGTRIGTRIGQQLSSLLDIGAEL
jgi:hypothetical protein